MASPRHTGRSPSKWECGHELPTVPGRPPRRVPINRILSERRTQRRNAGAAVPEVQLRVPRGPRLRSAPAPAEEESTECALMLLFRDRHVAPILAGTKTQTRRLWDKWRANVGSLHWASTHLYRKEARFARLAIVDRWEERLDEISAADAKAEGGYTPDQYLQLF